MATTALPGGRIFVCFVGAVEVLTNSSAPVHCIKKWLSGNITQHCSVELTTVGRAEIGRLDAGKRRFFLFRFFHLFLSSVFGRFRWRPVRQNDCSTVTP
jgi:hypothetical protein